jgi:excisionase family DNA binding protein
MTPDTAGHAAQGLTVREVARRYRVGEDKVRAWIAAGELRAINTAAVLCGKPRWVIPVDALAEFERRRAGAAPPKPPRRKRCPALVDYFP